jgi:hypothetical protein
VRFIGRLWLDDFLKCAVSAGGSSSEHIPNPTKFTNDNVRIAGVADMPSPPALIQ